MMRSLSACLRRVALVAIGLAIVPLASRGQQPQAPDANVGQFFTVVEPINDEVIERIKTSALPAVQRATAAKVRPVLVFEFLPGDAKPGGSSFGASFNLQEFIARGLTGAQPTVAFVPKPLSGYAVLAANLPAFRKTHTILSDVAAWEGGRRGILSADRARGVLVKLKAEDRAQVAEAYHLASTSDDPTLGGPVSPVLIKITGQLSQV